MPSISRFAVRGTDCAVIEEMARKEWKVVEEMLEFSYLSGQHMILTGSPGLGKTTAPYHLAKKVKATYTALTMHSDMAVQELIGHFVPQQSGAWAFEYGPLAKAFRDGHVVTLNEIDRACGAVITCLYNALDDPHIAQITTSDGVLTRASNFFAVATSNVEYTKLDLPTGLIDRFPLRFHLTYPHPAAVKTIQTDIIRRMVWESYQPNHAAFGHLTFRQFASLDKLLTAKVEKTTAINAVMPEDFRETVRATFAFA